MKSCLIVVLVTLTCLAALVVLWKTGHEIAVMVLVIIRYAVGRSSGDDEPPAGGLTGNIPAAAWHHWEKNGGGPFDWPPSDTRQGSASGPWCDRCGPTDPFATQRPVTVPTRVTRADAGDAAGPNRRQVPGTVRNRIAAQGSP